jgi:hypothetical protein
MPNTTTTPLITNDRMNALYGQLVEQSLYPGIDAQMVSPPLQEPSQQFFTGEEPGHIVTDPRHVGFEIECEGGSRLKLNKSMDYKCGDLKSDGSLSASGVELVTIPASRNILETIVREHTARLSTAGYSVSPRCGLHTHIDARDIREDGNAIGRLFKTVYAIERVIYSLIAPSRKGNSYCRSLQARYTFQDIVTDGECDDVAAIAYKVNKSLFPSIFPSGSYRTQRSGPGEVRYMGLNIQSIFYRGSVEFRYHEGTLDPDEMLHWAAFLQAIVKYAISDFSLPTMAEIYSLRSVDRQAVKLFTLLDLSETTKKYLMNTYLLRKETAPERKTAHKLFAATSNAVKDQTPLSLS